MTTRRISSRTFPTAPDNWDPASKQVWAHLIQVLEASEIFDKGRRTRPVFIIKGTVSAGVTVDAGSPSIANLSQEFARLLTALEGSNFVDIRYDPT